MAKKAARNQSDWKGFANVPFDAAARQAYEQFDFTDAIVLSRLEDLVARGYRVTFGYDKQNDAYQCSLTCNDEKSPNAGYTLTARGPAAWDALCVAQFKHYEVSAETWPHANQVSGDKWG